jgi:adenosylmethionine-8-amino-7-oxononanoate aminotransferase
MMTQILHRQIHHDYSVAVRGSGIQLFDEAGRAYIDASGGAAVSCLGHGHPDVLAAMHRQLDKLAYAHTSFFTSEPAEALAERLAAGAPGDLNHVYFVSGGSEGIEAALKMARQYFVERGEGQRRHFIARRQSYHGNTLGALAIGGNLWRKAPFAPILIESHHIDPCYAYRFRRPDETEAEYGERAAAELEAQIAELGVETVIAFVAETVVGATLGSAPAAAGYFRRIRDICSRHGILLILDEVMCGMGRTGTLHASEAEGIAPDLMVIAKGLGGGYAPIGAVLLSEHIYRAFAAGSGAFQHGHTYIGHPLACAAALAVQEVVARDNLLDNVRARGAQLAERLRQRFGNHHHIGEVRGRGLFQSVELVADRATKAPFAPELRLHARIKAEAMSRGLLVYPMGGTVDGLAGDHVLLAPPFIVEAAMIDEIVARLGESIDAAITSAQTRPCSSESRARE